MRLALLRPVAMVAAFLDIAIHMYLAPMHLEEKLYIGVAFLIGSAALAVTIVALVSERDRTRTAAWVFGAATSLVMAIAFVLSRTVGLPGQYLETWDSSPEDVLGLVSLGLELLFFGCCLGSITVGWTTKASGGSRRLSVHGRVTPTV